MSILKSLISALTPLESPAACSYEPSDWRVKDFLTGLICVLIYFFILADSVNAKQCTLMKPESLKKLKPVSERGEDMIVIFDVRPDISFGIKRIRGAFLAPLKRIEMEFPDKIDELIGEDVVLVGDDTKSAEDVCDKMMKKDYGLRNIYVLKGGMEKWDGPLAEDISKVECNMLTSSELMNMMKSGRKIEIMDRRQSEEYHEGHIPKAFSKPVYNDYFTLKFALQGRKWKMENKWMQDNPVVVYIHINEWHAMRECRMVKMKSKYEDVYVLRGGMKAWEGEVEKDYLEILKGKVKEKLK